MSFYNLLYHIVFATKHRHPTIALAEERRVYALLHSIMTQFGVKTLRIGGMPDHVHIFAAIPPIIAVANFIKELKRESSVAIYRDKILPKWEGWQEGYGCFSYSRQDMGTIIEYIKNQKEHHRTVSYIDELRNWLAENGISEDAPFFPKHGGGR